MATKSKQSKPKRAAKKTATPKRKTAKSAVKSAAKSTATKSHKTRRVTLGSGKSARKIDRPVDLIQVGGGTVREPRFAAAAELASQLVCTDADGKPTNRARIGSVQTKLVHDKLVSGKSGGAAGALKRIGFKSVPAARLYADGQPDSMTADRSKMTEAARRVGDPAKTKISGRALIGALVGLAVAKPKSK